MTDLERLNLIAEDFEIMVKSGKYYVTPEQIDWMIKKLKEFLNKNSQEV